MLLFYWLLLLETSFQCDPDNKALDCSKYTLWHLETIKNFSREAVDCNSTAARNGTVEVLCYKIVLNFGLAAGASHGSYHITMAFFNVATVALFMVKEVKTICKIRVSLIGLSLGIVTAYIMVAITSSRYYVVSDNLGPVVQRPDNFIQWISRYPSVPICAKISVFPLIQANMHTLTTVRFGSVRKPWKRFYVKYILDPE